MNNSPLSGLPWWCPHNIPEIKDKLNKMDNVAQNKAPAN